MNKTKTVAIGSSNSTKIDVFKDAFEESFPETVFEFTSYAVNSKVSDQPKGGEETLLGAYNRVLAVKEVEPNASYWCGMESGLIQNLHGYCNVGYVVIASNDGIVTYSRSADFYIPDSVANLIADGMNLSDACDIMFRTNKIGQNGGIVSVLTQGFIDRSDYYLQPAIFALLPHKIPKEYNASVLWKQEILEEILSLK